MSIPQRIIEEGRAADEALKALLTVPADGASDPGPAADPANGSTDPAQPPAPTAPAPVEPAPRVEPTSAEAELQRLRQQHDTLAGRTAQRDAELAELRGQLNALKDLQKAPATPPAPRVELITDADRSDFGEDMIDFVTRVGRQMFGEQLAQQATRLASVEAQLRRATASAQTAQQSAEELANERYLGKLDAMAPGWRATNDDAAFVDWLGNRGRFSRKTRHQLLADAHNEADADTVAEFFKEYWAETGSTPAVPASTPAPSAPTVDPRTLVAPTPSNAPTPTANPRAGRVWSQAEIEQVYDDRMKKKISPEKFAALEKEIEAAVLEGRVK